MIGDFAVIRGGRIYSLKPYRDPWGQKARVKYVGFCEGERVGFFQTKKDFETFIAWHARDGLSGQQLASIEAEVRSTADGLALLDETVRLNRLKGTRFHPGTDPACAAPCRKCGAAAGRKCRNYRGVNKQTCPDRGTPEPPPPEPPASDLFGGEAS